MTDADRGATVRAPAGAGWGWLLAYGILSLVLGMLALAWPFSATLTATWIVGAFFLAAGFVSLVAGVTSKGHEGRGYAVMFGIASAVIGLLMVLDPVSGAISLTLVVAIWLGMRGVLEIGLGARFRRHRWLMVGLGAVNLLLALYVLVTLPWSALTLPGFILGVSFILGGVTATLSALAHRKGAPAFSL